MEEKVFKKAGQLKEGQYMIIDNAACVIKSIEKSKPGKHGAAKVRITAVGLFDGQKRTFLGPVDADVEVPIVRRSNAQIVAIVDNDVQIMDMKTYEMLTVKKPEFEIKQGDEVEYMRYGNEASILRVKK